jgi:glycosyltransferase involved in cell wall biosynthesis
LHPWVEAIVNPYLSIIIPAHNEEHRLPQTLQQVLSFVSQQTYSTEVLIVENGSSDRTLEIATEFASQHPEFRSICENGRGKGLAIRRGMLESTGEYRFMCDADLSMPVGEINRFLPPELVEFDIAIASREAAGAVRYHEPLYRHLGGRAVNWMIRLLILPGLHDTQCGFKCFKGNIADDLFGRQTITGWSFDVELLFIARRRHYKIREVPIPWYFNPESKIKAFKAAFQLGLDILFVWINFVSGKYTKT